MVKVKDSPKPLLCHVRARSQATKKIFKNRDLPEECTIGDCWRRAFIMTYIWWAAQWHDPWNMNDNEAILALQRIFNTIYDMSVCQGQTVDPIGIRGVIVLNKIDLNRN